MNKTGIGLMILLLLVGPGLAQDKPVDSKKKFPLELTFFKHAISYPFEGILSGPLHPGFSVGTEYYYTQGHRGQIFQNLNAGYFFNKYNAKALFLETSAGYRYTLGFGLFGDLALGLGYLHSFHPVEVYTLNSQGEYERAKDKGKSAVIFPVVLGLGYDFSRKLGWPLNLFFRYQIILQTPYNQDSSIMGHSMLHIGIRIHIW